MFDIGFTELMLIGIVSLVVIGPERLPAVARTAGQWVAKLQRFVRGVKTDLASELETGDLKKLIGDQREQIDELKKMVHSAKQDFEGSTREAIQGAQKGLKEMETSFKEIDGEPENLTTKPPEHRRSVDDTSSDGQNSSESSYNSDQQETVQQKSNNGLQ